MSEPSSACVLLFHPETRLVLVELHPDGLGLPGGRREQADASSLACAARELREETGTRLERAASVLVYRAGPHLCEAFIATAWASHTAPYDPARAREMHCAWVEAEELVGSAARFPSYCARLFATLCARERRRDLREVEV